MNIQEAEQEVVRTVRAYTKKNEMGEYLIPVEKQRPLLLIAPESARPPSWSRLQESAGSI